MSAKSTKCPKCAIKAIGTKEIELKFGWRESKGKKILQSWCRRCRSGQSIDEPDEDKKELEKSIQKNLQSYANRLYDLDSLRLLFTKPDGLNFNYKNEDLDTESWSVESKRMIEQYNADLKIFAEKLSLDIIYIQIKTNIEKDWKTLAREVFKRYAGFCLVITHNLDDLKWLFTGSTGSENIAKHLTVEIKDQDAPQDFVNWLYKIRAEKVDTLQTLISKIDLAFDDYAVDIQDKLGENVFDALKTLMNEAIFNLDNKLDFNNETLQRINDSLFTLLYRLVFILYAESREIFDTNNKKYYGEFSLKKIVTEYIRVWEKDPKKVKLEKYELWNRFKNLFVLIEGGAKSFKINPQELEMPAYNGSLFNAERHPELEKWKFNNDALFSAIHNLTRIQDKEKNWSFVNYDSIEIRHIGTIYEKLLEFHPVKVGNRIEIFTEEGKREAEGTYYTPKFIVDNIVENSLGPIVDQIICDQKDPNEQIEKILQLKILDPAIGSGHFLVGAANYLANRIIGIEQDKGQQNFIKRKREVVRRCLYGVDKNSLAVELAKVSLWLDTLSSSHALSFLATHLKNGDSILSAWRKEIFDIQTTFSEDPSRTYFRNFVKKYSAFETIDDHLASTVRAKIEEEQETRKRGTDYDHIKHLLDSQLSKYYGKKISNWRDLRSKVGTKDFDEEVESLDWAWVRQISKEKKFFHWELEFPQIFFDQNGEKLENPGFDVIIGNPPYGVKYADKYYSVFGLGNKDSYGFFIKRCIDLLKKNGILSFVVSDTWRTTKTHKPLREFILDTCQIKRLIKLNRYAFKTHGRNIDAFTIILEFEKKSNANQSYFYYDFWQIHPLNEKKYFSDLMEQALFYQEKVEWPFDRKRTFRYKIPQKIGKISEDRTIFEGSTELFKIFDENAPLEIIEVT